jgi:hypothetical protein
MHRPQRTVPFVQRLPQVVAALVAALLVALAAPALSAGAGRFDIGLQDPFDTAFGETDTNGAFRAMNAENVRFVRVPVAWAVIAPTKPANASDYNDPAYRWDDWLTERIRVLRQAGREPLVVLYNPPRWAWGRNPEGDPFITAGVDDYSDFAQAAAERYNGSGDKPRVKYWEIFNEPNLFVYWQDGPEQYRDLMNAAYDKIHGVHDDNVVVGGSLAPFVTTGNGVLGLQFMREVLCVSKDRTPRKTCDARSSFDAWSVHPYTSGAPRHKATAEGNISLGNLPEVLKILRAADRLGNVKSRGRPQLWITEFSWDTLGPDPGGVPLARHARWVAEALYRMWQNDVSVLTWFQLRDNPEGAAWGDTWQSGLYFRTTDKYADERRKPFADVIRFPFAAVPSGSGVTAWGRTPDARRRTVTIERRAGRRWRRVARVRSNAGGIFRRRIRGARGATFRARSGRSRSKPYKATPNPDVRVNPFGGPLRG